MTFDDFRGEMNAYWQSADEEARSRKDPHISLERLTALYGKFDAGERQMADRVLAEWVLSEDEGLRFDARVLIDHRKIVMAMPALEEVLVGRVLSGWARGFGPTSPTNQRSAQSLTLRVYNPPIAFQFQWLGDVCLIECHFQKSSQRTSRARTFTLLS